MCILPETYFGRSSERQRTADQCGYLLFYQHRTEESGVLCDQEKERFKEKIKTNSYEFTTAAT